MTSASSGASGGEEPTAGGIAFRSEAAVDFRLFDVARAGPGEYVVAGMRDHAAWAARMTTAGEVVWEVWSQPTKNGNYFGDVALRDDGVAILVGRVHDPDLNSSEGCVVRVGAGGQVEWARCGHVNPVAGARLDGLALDEDKILVGATRDGVLAVGWDGEVLGRMESDLIGHEVVGLRRLAPGMTVAVGHVRGVMQNQVIEQPWIGLLADDGSLDWQYRLSATPGILRHVTILPDGKLVAAGFADGRALLAAFAPSGSLSWIRTAGGPEQAMLLTGSVSGSEGTLVTTGHITTAGTPGQAALLLRWTTDGTLLRARAWSSSTWNTAMAAARVDERIVVAGRTGDSGLVAMPDEIDALGGCSDSFVPETLDVFPVQTSSLGIIDEHAAFIDAPLPTWHESSWFSSTRPAPWELLCTGEP